MMSPLSSLSAGARDVVSASLLPDTQISINFVLYVYDDSAAVGTDVFIGAAVEVGTDEIWAGQVQATIQPYTALTGAGVDTVSTHTEHLQYTYTTLTGAGIDTVSTHTIHIQYTYIPLTGEGTETQRNATHSPLTVYAQH